MARSVKIKTLRTRNDSTVVRYGKSEVEVSGGKRGFREWVKEQVRDSDEFLLAIALACLLDTEEYLSPSSVPESPVPWWQGSAAETENMN